MFGKVLSFAQNAVETVKGGFTRVLAVLALVATCAVVPTFAQETPTIYDPGVNISGMTTVAADGLGDIVTTVIAVAFGFMLLAFGMGWVKKWMRSK